MLNFGLYNTNTGSILGMANPTIVIQQNNIMTHGNVDST